MLALVSRLAYHVSWPIRKLVINNSTRVNVLIIWNDKLLLVKNRFSDQEWVLPGGGVKKGEELTEAAAREIREELKIHLKPLDVQELGSAEHHETGISWHIDFLVVEISDQTAESMHRQPLEILEAAWFPFRRLPRDRRPLVDQAMALWRQVI